MSTPGQSSTQVPGNEAGMPARPPWWARKWPQRAMYAAVAVVLALGFLAYQSPDLRANWEAIAALCGF